MSSLEHLFISGPGRSGTTLIKDLLDGHGQVCAWPNEWQYISRFRKFVGHDLWEKRPVAEIVAAMDQDSEKFASVRSGEVTDRRAQTNGVSLNEVNPGFGERLMADPDRMVDAFEFYGVAADAYRWSEDQTVFCNKCNDPEYITDYVLMFPASKFLFSIRNPIDVFISKLRYRAGSYTLVHEQYANSVVFQSYYEVKCFFKFLRSLACVRDPGARFQVLRMEDVLDDPQAAVAGIADFLGIENDDCLMSLSFLGEPIEGNFATAQDGGDKILSKDRTLYRETGLTEAEKRWFEYDLDLFVDHYPDIEAELERTPTVGFLERSYRQYVEFRCAGEESLDALQKFETEFMELQTLQP